MSGTAQKGLARIGFRPIRKQIEILEQCTGITFSLDANTLDLAEEMALVRNLGIHNRWEVNGFYRSESKSSSQWSDGEIRVFDSTELQQWYKSLIDMTHATSFPIAKLYCSASGCPV